MVYHFLRWSPVLSALSDGLMEVIPGTGKVVQTESGTDWMTKKSAKKSVRHGG